MLIYYHALFKSIPVLVVLMLLFRVVCRWKVFSKMNLRPWTSLIPGVSEFLMFRKTWKTWPFVVLLILAVVFGLIVQTTAYMNIYLPIPTYVKAHMTLISIVCLMLIPIFQYKHLAFAFGHDVGYMMGLLFLNPIFLGILAFSKDTFHEDLAALRGKELREHNKKHRTLGNRILSTVAAMVIMFSAAGYIGYVMLTEQQPAFMVKSHLSDVYEQTSGKVSGKGKVIYPAIDMVSDSDGSAPSRDLFFGDKSGVAETTVYMYLIGSNLEDATGSASINLAQIKDATAAGDKLRFIIEAGGTDRWFTDGFKDRKTARYMIKDGEVTLLEVLPDNTCMSKEKTLEDFLKWAKKEYPSDRTMLFFWDHGGGLSGYGVDSLNPREDQKMLSMPEIVQALDAAGSKYDLIGFDACLMQTMEVALSLEPYADYMLGSEESEPASGMYYTAAFSRLANEPDLSTLKFGAMMCSSYDQSLELLNDGKPQAGQTLSMTELRYMPEAARTFISYLDRLDRDFMSDKDSFTNMSMARSKAYEFQMDDQIDLIDFIGQSSISTDAKNLMISKINRAIAVRSAASANHINGLAVYMPYDNIPGYTNAYNTLKALDMTTETKVYNDFATIIGSQKTPSDTGPGTTVLKESYKEQPWYRHRFEDYDVSVYRENIKLTDVGGEYKIDLTDEEWETITNYEQGLRMKIGSRYVDLGSDNVFDIDQNGHYMLEFNDTWVAIDGVVVALHPGTPKDRDDGTILYTGTVDATLNFIYPIKIYIEWVDTEDEEGEGVVVGYLPADQDSNDIGETGMPRGLKQFKASSVVSFLYDWYDEDGNYLSTAAGHLPIDVGVRGLTVSQKDISDQEYYYYGILYDVLNRTMETEKLYHRPQ
ncbi:MAG: clostripain-related cysteine peptidase [Bacillota bacterium]